MGITMGKQHFLLLLLLGIFGSLFAQNDEVSIFVNDGEKVIYNVAQDSTMQKGTVSDALQNVPGVKVDTEGNLTLRGVDEVELWIDDRPAHLNAEAQKNYLQHISAATLYSIEVITNPSARYTSQTNTGIINIITRSKKQITQMLTVGLKANTKPTLSPSIAYRWSNEKLSLSANLKGDFVKQKSNTNGWSCGFDSVAHGNVHSLDTANYMKFDKVEAKKGISFGGTFNVDYAIDEKNDFSAYLNIFQEFGGENQTKTVFRKEYIHSIGEYHYEIGEEENEQVLYGSVGAYYQHRFNDEGHNISINLNSDFDFGDVRKHEKRDFKEVPQLNRDIKERNLFTDIGWDVKIDYNLPLAKNSLLYLGFVNNFHPDNNVLDYDTLNFATELYQQDALRSENRKFNTNQSEWLAIFEQHFGRFTLRPGVAFNLTRIKATYYDTPQYNRTKFFPLFKPSIHLTYRTASSHNFSISYTRKNTFDYVRKFTERVVYGEEDFSIGNPDLKPTLMDVFEGEWAKYWDNFGSVSVKAYYKNHKDAINDVAESRYDSIFGRAVTFNKPYNVGKFSNAGLECNVTYRPSAMFNIRLDGDIYDSYLRTKFKDKEEKNEMLCYSVRLNVWAKLWDRLELMATAYYSSPTQTLYASYQTAYGINCGVRADFFKNRLSVLLNANDIFNWNKENNNIYSPTYISYTTTKTNSRYVSLELIFKIL